MSCEIGGFLEQEGFFFLNGYSQRVILFLFPVIPHKPRNIKLKDENFHTMYYFIFGVSYAIHAKTQPILEITIVLSRLNLFHISPH